MTLKTVLVPSVSHKMLLIMELVGSILIRLLDFYEDSDETVVTISN